MGPPDPEHHSDPVPPRARPASGAIGAAPAARPVSLGADRLAEAVRHRLGLWVALEAGPGRLFAWIPVAFGAGIALYFSAEREPAAWIVAACALVLIAGAALARARPTAFLALALAAATASGFAAASLRAQSVAHHVLTKSLYAAKVTGIVEMREPRERSDRVVLRVEQLEAGRNPPRLERVRIAFRKGQAPPVGARIAVKARLSPPVAAVRPGGYDFARDMYFAGLSASGFALGRAEIVEGSPSGWRIGLASVIQAARDAIDARIGSAISGDAKAIASALITGRREAISAPVNDAMYISGLGHVLSISGYHMAVVAGLVFFLVRLGLACVPGLASGWPIKTWASLVALGASAFYLVLSGAEVATQRAFVMTAIVLAGIMVDRRAITFRTLAIAALIVLVLTPEALVHPSFQMSFAATLAIVALVEGGMPGLLPAHGDTWTARAAAWGGREFVALVLVSLVAGFATTPAVAFHFHRIAPYGLIANLLAMPVVSFWVMPAGILGLLAMPFGFDPFFWRLMEGGILWMNAVAQWVASLPGAVGPVHAFSVTALALASAGLVVLCLLRGPLRWSGALLIALAIGSAALAPLPDVIVAPDGRSLALRGADGRLRVLSFQTKGFGRDAFAIREWLAADGDTRMLSDAALVEGVRCDANGCMGTLAGYGAVALAGRVEAFDDDCRRARLIVTRIKPPPDCRALVIGPDDIARFGALALHREGDAFRISAARPEGYERPWARAPASASLATATELSSRISPIRNGRLAPPAVSQHEGQPARTAPLSHNPLDEPSEQIQSDPVDSDASGSASDDDT